MLLFVLFCFNFAFSPVDTTPDTEMCIPDLLFRPSYHITVTYPDRFKHSSSQSVQLVFVWAADSIFCWF